MMIDESKLGGQFEMVVAKGTDLVPLLQTNGNEYEDLHQGNIA